MQISGNTMLITGGTSGIGRALAESLHQAGNKVIVAGRRKALLEAVAAAHPGIETTVLDVEDIDGLSAFAAKMVQQYPALNVLINNAGIMKSEDLTDPAADFSVSESIIRTNLTAPLRLTTALLPHFRKQAKAAVMNVSSGLAFVPLAVTPTYNATKAALHSWTQSLRWQLRETNVEVIELIPPYVQTELQGAHQASDPRAMPLPAFIAEVMNILRTRPDAKEILVQRVHPLRFAAEKGEAGYDEMFRMINGMVH